MVKDLKMNNLIIKFIVTILMVNALISAQQNRMMFEKLVEKKGVVFVSGEKKTIHRKSI